MMISKKTIRLGIISLLLLLIFTLGALALYFVLSDETIYLSAVGSPDGSRIAFVSISNNTDTQVYVMNSDGSSKTNITENRIEGSYPVWSPDSNMLVFMGKLKDGKQLNAEIYLVSFDNADPVNITQSESYDGEPTWSPDGRKIAFVSERDQFRALYVMNVDGTDLMRLTDATFQVFDPVWASSGNTIIFASKNNADNFEIVSMNIETGNYTTIAEKTEYSRCLSLSPNRKLVAFVTYTFSDGKSAASISTINMSTMTLTDLVSNQSLSCPRWSPDSNRLAVFVGEKLKVYEVDGTSVLEIVLQGSKMDIFWSTDNNEINVISRPPMVETYEISNTS